MVGYATSGMQLYNIRQYFILSVIGTDFTPLDLIGTFSPDTQDMPLCFELLITDDNIVEASEVVFISLSSNDSAVLVSSEAQQLNITIQDNDGKFDVELLNLS